MSNNSQHSFFQSIAYNLAYNNLGLTYPNPSVGAVIVKDGRIISKAVTSGSGGSHAELLAINNAIEDVKGADLYVTLEPCSHFGKNPPCTEAILSSGIKRVFYSYKDPNPLVNGSGIFELESKGVECFKLDICDVGISHYNPLRYNRDKAFVSLKLATSLDMKIALKNGDSKWITNDKSRRYGHYLRRVNDITITGVGTVLADDPSYNCRLDDNKETYLAILDSNLRVSHNAKVFQEGVHKKIFVFFDKQLKDTDKLERFNSIKNLELVPISKNTDGLDLSKILSFLEKKEFFSILVESGPCLISSFVDLGLVDLFYMFSANKIIGKGGRDAFNIRSPEKLINCRNLSLVSVKTLGQDILRILAANRLIND